jgi:hypothetical protein
MLENIPMQQQKLKVWLTSGYIERGMFNKPMQILMIRNGMITLPDVPNRKQPGS